MYGKHDDQQVIMTFLYQKFNTSTLEFCLIIHILIFCATQCRWVTSLLTDNLIINFPFNGGLNDISGNGVTANFVGTPPLTTDRFGANNQAYMFSGGNYIVLPSSATLEIGTSDFTLSAWVKRTSLIGTQRIITHGMVDCALGGYFLQITDTTNAVHGGVSCTQCVTSSSLSAFSSLNEWHLLTFVVKRNMLNYMYFDGGPFSLNANTVTPACNTTATGKKVMIGAENAGYYNFLGAIDEVRIYKQALSASEVKDLYSLAIHLPFDGNTIDASGNGHAVNVIGATPTADRNGILNRAYHFTANSVIQLSASGYSDIGTHDSTIAAWIRPETITIPGSLQRIFSHVSSAGNIGYIFSLTTANAVSFLAGCTNTTFNPIATSTQTIPVNIWTHVSVTVVRGGVIQIYINGYPVATSFLSPAACDLSTGTVSNIGTFNHVTNTDTFLGDIDELRLYNRALSAAEIKAIYRLEQPVALQSSVDRGLLVHLPFTGNAEDVSVNGFATGVVGAPPLTEDRFAVSNQAYLFSAGKYVSIASYSLLELGTSDFTLSAWVKRTSTVGHQRILSRGAIGCSGVSRPGYFFQFNDDSKLYGGFECSNGCHGIQTASSFTALNEWHLVTLTVQRGVASTMYYDGVVVGVGTAPSCDMTSIGDKVQIGADHSGSTGFEGAIDDVRIYKRALSVTEVMELMYLAAYFPFNGNAFDASTNSLTSSVTGATLVADQHGNPNQAYLFTTESFITVADNPALNMGTGDFTLSARIKLSPVGVASYRRIISRGLAGGGCGSRGYFLQEYSSKASGGVVCTGTGCVYAQSEIVLVSTEDWYLVTLTVQRDVAMTIYINGILVTTGTAPSTCDTAITADLLIGNSAFNEQFLGVLDEVRVYRKALSSLEVKTLAFVSQPSSQPSRQPSCQPSQQPMSHPTRQPTSQPSQQPSCQPHSKPSSQPSDQPVRQPSMQPFAVPSCIPTLQPSRQSSMQPSSRPSSRPSGQPTYQPTIQPYVCPTSFPSTQPTSQPSMQPGKQPIGQPTGQPSGIPSQQPKRQPSAQPSHQPLRVPTSAPSTQPTKSPSIQPLSCPSARPSTYPSVQPSSLPSQQPSCSPSIQPFSVPSVRPTAQPWTSPSSQPSLKPSSRPSSQPSVIPSVQPTSTPSQQPARCPTVEPTVQSVALPSVRPTTTPSFQPCCSPSSQPSGAPSSQPLAIPTSLPSSQPLSLPSVRPTSQPFSLPSSQPSRLPSSVPSCASTLHPNTQPTCYPTCCPATQPTTQPSLPPTLQISSNPSVLPNGSPSSQPSVVPSCCPSKQPIVEPSTQPSLYPSRQPSSTPSSLPSMQPSIQPWNSPTSQPTASPLAEGVLRTSRPSHSPSFAPTLSLPQRTALSVYSESFVNITMFKIVLPFMFTLLVASSTGLSDITIPRPSIGKDYLFMGSNRTYNGGQVSVSALSFTVPSVSYDFTGRSVSIAGDVNGDGNDDLIIGVPFASVCYVLFGTKQGFVNVTEGFTVLGALKSDLTGWSVSGAGDVNNDTYADIIIGAPNGGTDNRGAAYIIYGKGTQSSVIDLTSLAESNGFTVMGANPQDNFALSVSRAGDVNGDGLHDILVGALKANTLFAGAAYIIFGRQSPSNIDLTNLLLDRGHEIRGPPWSWFGYSVSGAGDVNGDGVDDIIVGSVPRRTSVGTPMSYIIYGGVTLHTVIEAQKIPPSQGLIIVGGGVVVSGIGDLNKDGFDDVMIGSDYGFDSGGGYVVIFPRGLSAITSSAPIPLPSLPPTRNPNAQPSLRPSCTPTVTPSVRPTQPTVVPSVSPTGPTWQPSMEPSQPTSTPSKAPLLPTVEPSVCPTECPSILPSMSPTQTPTMEPSTSSTSRPSTKSPTVKPSVVATQGPTRYPVVYPTIQPTVLQIVNTTYTQVVVRTAQVARRNALLINYIVNMTESVVFVGTGSECMFTLYPINDTQVTIVHFNTTSDILSLEAFPYIHTIDDLNISSTIFNRTGELRTRHLRESTNTVWKVRISLTNRQVVDLLHIPISELQDKHFIFSQSLEPNSQHSFVKGHPAVKMISSICGGVIAAYILYKIIDIYMKEHRGWLAKIKPINWEEEGRNNKTYISFNDLSDASLDTNAYSNPSSLASDESQSSISSPNITNEDTKSSEGQEDTRLIKIMHNEKDEQQFPTMNSDLNYGGNYNYNIYNNSQQLQQKHQHHFTYCNNDTAVKREPTAVDEKVAYLSNYNVEDAYLSDFTVSVDDDVYTE